MASKQYFFLVGIFCLLASSGISQKIGGSYDVKDTTVISSKRMPQHTEFLNGTNNFPAKPRNQWEIGVKAGTFSVSSDVQQVFPTFGFGAHIRKAFGYVFSMRLAYMYGIGRGLSWVRSENYGKNTPWIDAGYAAPVRNTTGLIVASNTGLPFTTANPQQMIFYNYQTTVQDLSVQGVVTLNNIRFHKAKTGLSIYGFGGLGATVYETKVNALDGTTRYNFASITVSDIYKSRKDTRKAIKNLMDDSYESPAENQGARRPKLFGNTLKPSGTIGFGVAFKLSSRINLSFEDRQSFIKDDLLDGQRWQEHARGEAVLSRDYDSYNFASVGLNINLGAKSVEPLWWLNPLDYAYSEIRNPRLMRLPKPVLPDSDSDGITDQFDREQTPQGCAVDSHGVSLDTDGDGVPDCKDKELITPTYCQPVDADGIGKCKCPDDCKVIAPPPVVVPCSQKLGSLPSVAFMPNSNNLSSDAKAVLASVAARMRNNPECNVVVTGYCASNKKEQQLSWDHVNAIINYLVEKEGIRADRLIFSYGLDGGDCNTVDLRSAADGEAGPNTVPAPHPNLRKLK